MFWLTKMPTPNLMKQAILFAALMCIVYSAGGEIQVPRGVPTPRPLPKPGPRPTPTAPVTPTPLPGVVETYKVVDGMSIRATVYDVDARQQRRVAIVIHGGGYLSGGMQTVVAQELSQYGFMGVAIEYR